jgi:hypothetical protein
MEITLQKRIGYFWLLLATVDLINMLYKNILRFGHFGLNNFKFYSQPYFEQIFSCTFPKISAASPHFQIVIVSEWCFFVICSLISVLIPTMLILDKRHSRTIAKVFLILFVLTNLLAINEMVSLLSPIELEYEVESDIFFMNTIYYYSTISFISILMFVGLFYCKPQNEERIETI